VANHVRKYLPRKYDPRGLQKSESVKPQGCVKHYLGLTLLNMTLILCNGNIPSKSS